MNKRSIKAGRFALSAVAAAIFGMTASASWALGLGRLSVQSALGESLRAEIDVTSITPEEASSLRVRIAPPESYRAAGVDYNSVLPGTQAQLERRPDGRPFVQLTSDRAVQEPFVDVILEVSWSSGRLVREYTMLFDPPAARVAPPAVAAAPTPPVISAAPAPAPSAQAAASPAPVAAAPVPGASATPPARRTAPAPAPSPTAAAPASNGDRYTVKSGDTLYKIASDNARPGVSLDQMLVSLYRGNPQAFIGDNMNRLKAGTVLSVPSSDAAGQVTAPEARQVIQAQSADFSAYRQRLAGNAPTMKSEDQARQVKGQVQAQVDDRKQAAAPTPDKLKLSQGTGKAAAPEAAISKAAEKQESATRVAELSRNVEELKKLSAGTAVAAAPPASAPGVLPVPVEQAPAPVVTVRADAASAPASAPLIAAAPVAAASDAASAPVTVAKAPTPAPVAPTEEPGPLDSLLDNPMLLPGAGVLVALLAGFGFYRLRRKVRKETGETSFLESRLQPDSFFGASGGQRIDTRDAGGASSSMSYSLSQLDAIGDVDPVAEADVYLAYGRDLQAEEILKEAMRANPDRLAIRTKLLEVYAKRRDTKGYELLATQLFSLTRGDGEEWQKTQELGLQIDPENPLYQPGGQPPAIMKGGDPGAEPLGASTMPQSLLPSPSTFAATNVEPADAGPPSLSDVDLDLDLDLVAPAPPVMPSPVETTQPIAASSSSSLDDGLDFDLPELPPSVDFRPEPAPVAAYAAPAAQARQPEREPEPMAFDLDALSLDLDLPAPAAPPAHAAAPSPAEADFDFGNLDLPTAQEGESAFTDDADPLQRKFELAEEFRQIGDTEGARDLLEEVVAKAGGPLKTRAQGLLDALV